MKILVNQFLGKNHSWSIVGQNVARSLINKGHQVDLFSTNGVNYFPEDLKPYLIGYVEEMKDAGTHAKVHGKPITDTYDMQFSYTRLPNAQEKLNYGSKNRFLQWTFEFSSKNALPTGFAKHYVHTDLIIPPSNYAKQIFLDSGIPENHMKVVPHGINFNDVDTAVPYPLKTKKSTKILAVVAQIHRRKNLSGMLEMFGKAFTKKDDVCLVLKIQDRKPTMPFELDFFTIFSDFKSRFRDHAEIEIVKEFVPNIYSLYKSCDIVFSASHCEGFGITALDAHALGKINVVSHYGGFLDFANQENSLVIEGKEFFVPSNFLYYSSSVKTKAFMPNIDSGIEQLRTAVKNKEQLLKQYQSNMVMAKEKYDWGVIADQIMELTTNV